MRKQQDQWVLTLGLPRNSQKLTKVDALHPKEFWNRRDTTSGCFDCHDIVMLRHHISTSRLVPGVAPFPTEFDK